MTLQVANLSKKYKQKSVLHNISFTIGEGEVIGLVGPNGAGKSTLMRSILGLETIEEGKVSIQNIRNDQKDFYKYISFLPSDNYLYMDLTGYDHLAFVANIYHIPKEAITQVIEEIGITSYVHQPVKSYSYGMRQHLLIALSILTNPKLILMDEPFNGLDPTSIIELKQLIHQLKGKGMSIIVSTHSLDILEDLTEKVWFIKDGQLHQDVHIDQNDVPFEIKLANVQSIKEVMATSNLPYEEHDGTIITDSAYTIDNYLMYLIQKNVEIASINRQKRTLEQFYRKFYNV